MSAGALSPTTPSSEDGMASVPLDDRSAGKSPLHGGREGEDRMASVPLDDRSTGKSALHGGGRG